MLTLLIGRAGSGKSDFLVTQICQSTQRRQLLIVPEQFSHEAERRLCAVGGNGISRHGEVLSFTRLYNRVCAVCGGGAAPSLDGGGRLLLMHNAVGQVAAHLSVYARPSQKPQFLSGLLTTLDECKSYCVTPEDLGEAASQTDGLEGQKLADLALIFGAYEALCARVAADPRDQLTKLAARLKESGFARGLDIYIDGFTDFTPQERLVLSALLRDAHGVTVALTCDKLEEETEDIFSPARRTGKLLLRLAEDCRAPTQTVHPPKREEHKALPLQWLEEHLMDSVIVPQEGPCPNVELFAASSPWSEMEWAAARILELVQSGEYRFRDIAVAARRFEGYDELAETLFRRYGIPVFCAKNSDILEKPILALITSALDAVSGGYAYDDVFRYLKTGLTDLSDEERDLLENYVLTWNIRGSKWTQKADWEMNPGGFGLGKKAGDQALLARLNNIRRRVVLPLETLRKNQNKTGRGHALALYRFLQEIGLTKKLTERTEGLRARGQLRLAEEYGQLWDIVRGGLEQCALLLDSTAMELGEFARLLALVLSQYDVGTIPVSLDRVTAGECTRMGYRKIKVLLLLGCDDSAMPMAAPSPGLFTDDDRALLAELGLELAPSLEHKLSREMTIAYVAAATPTERLLVSYAQNSAAGEGQRPAFLLNRLRMLFPDLPLVYEEDTDAFRLAAPGPALELAGVRAEVREALAALPDYREKVERITRGLSLTRGQLSPKAVSALYGKKVPMSASRMDLYKSCHFSYFMQYGLKARPRERAGFEAPEYGTFMHDILEHVLQEKDFFGADEKTLKKLVAGAVRRYVDEDLGGLESKTPRFRYLFNRLQRSVRQVVHNVAEELAASDFQPIAFELGFTENGALPPIEVQSGDLTISVTGFVDRVDGWQKDGKLYIRVVDYKTGYKSFDLTDIQNGMGLQMLLYLFTLEKEGKRLFGTDVTPAGVLYLPARDVVLPGNRSTTAGEQQKKQDTELRRKGLLLGDKEVLEAMEHPGFAGIRFLPIGYTKDGTFTGEALVDGKDWKKLGRHVEKVLGEIGEELASGTVDADPYWRSTEHNACRYCRYAAACQFEEEQGDCRRYLPTVKSEEFWKGLR